MQTQLDILMKAHQNVLGRLQGKSPAPLKTEFQALVFEEAKILGFNDSQFLGEWITELSTGPKTVALYPDFHQVGTPKGPSCVCMNCPGRPHPAVLFNGEKQGCVIFAVAGPDGLIVQRFPSERSSYYSIRTGNVELNQDEML